MISKTNTLVGPKGHFLWGNFAEFRGDELAFLTRCAQEYSGIVPLSLFRLPIYLLLDSDDIEQALITRRQDFVKSRMYRLMDSLMGNGLGLSEGDFWLRQRRLIQPAFHRERIEAYGQVMVTHAEKMLAGWREGQLLDIVATTMNLTLAITTKALLSCDAENDPDGKGISEALKEVTEIIAARFRSPIPIPETIPTPMNRRYQKTVQHVEGVIYRIIQQRRAKPEDTGDLLSMLLEAQDDDGSHMTEQQLRDEIMTAFIGGTDTSAASLYWTWYLLSQHPQVEAKLLAELDTVLGGRRPTAADLLNLPYLEMVYTESLRYYAPGPLLGRKSIKEVEMGGHHFPAGTEFWISPWAMHHNPRHFESPEVFRPERWEGDLAKRLPKFAYMPFSHGPRGCIGNMFAKMEAKLVLATVAQKFHLGLAPGQVVEPEFSMTLLPKHGIKMVATPRHPTPRSAQLAATPAALPVGI